MSIGLHKEPSLKARHEHLLFVTNATTYYAYLTLVVLYNEQ